MNKIIITHRLLQDLIKIDSHEDFHNYLFEDAIRRYQMLMNQQGKDLGSVLAVCANYREALVLPKFSFSKILITGINEPDDKLRGIMENNPRISYQKQNCENISLKSQSYDLVLCKEGLHHLARPVQGLYEMLRVSKNATIFIEPYDTAVGRILDVFNLRSMYERNMSGNILHRDNFVFRWSKRNLQQLLNSYYLESGYHLDITLGWLSGRFSLHRSKYIRRCSAISGWAFSFIPGCYGNYMTAIILPGSDIPADSNHSLPDY